MRKALFLLAIYLLPAACFAQWVDLGSNSKLSTVCPPNATSCNQSGTDFTTSCDLSGSPYAYAAGTHSCDSTVSTWSSMVVDSVNHNAFVWGGGHSDSGSNAWYRLSGYGTGTGTMTRIKDPSHLTTAQYTAGTASCSGSTQNGPTTNGDGTPLSRHTGGGLVWLPPVSEILIVSGGLYGGNGFHQGDLWLFDPFSGTYTAETTKFCAPIYVIADYDANTDSVILTNNGLFDVWRYCYRAVSAQCIAQGGTDTLSRLTSGPDDSLVSSTGNGAIEPVHQQMWFFGDGTVKCMDITGAHSCPSVNTGAYYIHDVTSQTRGCAQITSISDGFNSGYPGVAPDGNGHLYVWDATSNSLVYDFDPTTLMCNAVALPNGLVSLPPINGGLTADQAGVFGHMRFDTGLKKFVLIASANKDAYTLTPNLQGLGGSTVTASGPCLDKDGDGYGIGAGCLGPDADDNDSAIHTAAQAITKYGSLDAFYQHLGYQFISAGGAASPVNWYTVSTGTCGAAASSHNIDTSITNCFATLAAIGAPTSPYGIIFRGGVTYTNVVNYTPPSGTANNQNVVLQYPGEIATMDAGTHELFTSAFQYVTVDGFKCINASRCWDDQPSVQCLYPSACAVTAGNTLRHMEASGDCAISGCFFGYSPHLALIEEVVAHDQTLNGGTNHPFYYNGNPNGAADMVVHRSMFYNSINGSTSAAQFALPWTYIDFSQNWIWNSEGSGLTVEEGVTNGKFNDLVVWDTADAAIKLIQYDSGQCHVNGLPDICPTAETSNLFENDTLWVGTLDPQIGTAQNISGIVFANSTASDVCTPLGQSVPCGSMGGNTFRNIVLMAGQKFAGGAYPPVVYSPVNSGLVATDMSTSTWANILLCAQDGCGSADTFVAGNGFGPSFGFNGLTCAQFAMLATVTNCQNTDPKFVNALTSDWGSPQNFNFHLQLSSPALGAGTTTGLPTSDTFGNSWSSPPPEGGITGTAVPGACLTPSSLGFGNQFIHVSSVAQNATLTSCGSAALTVSNVSTSGPNAGDFFLITSPGSNCGGTLAVNATCTISITFTPSLIGSETATLNVTDNATGSPQTVSLSGFGIQPSRNASRMLAKPAPLNR